MTGVPEPFGIDLRPVRETIVLEVRGEIDMTTAGQLSGQLRELIESGFARVVLDLRRVSFMDSTGLRAVLEASAIAGAGGVDFALIRGSDAVQRVFELTCTESRLRFIDPPEIDSHTR